MRDITIKLGILFAFFIGCGGAQSSGVASTNLVTGALAPSQGQTLWSAKVTFSGRTDAAAGAGVSVAVRDGALAQRSCKAIVAADQTWSCAILLADGGYTWTATAGDAPASGAIDFVVSTSGMPAPLIAHTPSPTARTAPALTGTASAKVVSANATVIVTESGRTICTAPLRSTTWSCAIATPLADGPHLFAAVVQTPSGDDCDDDDDGDPRGPKQKPNPGKGHDDDGCELVKTAPSNPDLFVVKTSIANPTVDSIPTPTDRTTIAFSGKGEPGAVVTVAEGASALCRATVAGSGAWTCAAEALADGTHDVRVSQEDAAGNVSGAVSVTFVIDTHLPSAPTIDAVPTPTANSSVRFTGSGEAGDVVKVLDSYQHLLCTATVASTATWSCSAVLSDGDYLVSAFQTTPVGKRSGPSDAVPVSVRTLTAPLFDAIASPTRNPSPVLSGTAAASANVTVLFGEAPVCSATAGSDGRWSCVPAAPFADGSYLLAAQASDSHGHASPNSETRFLQVDTTPPPAPVLDAIAYAKRPAVPVVSGSAEPSSSVQVRDAQTGEALCTATATAAGTFQCEATLQAGARVTATATDAAGNTSAPAQPVTYSNAAVAPHAPTIDSPANASELRQRRPSITGHTDPGTFVQVTLDGAQYAAQVDAQGAWMLTPPSDLQTGTHQISALAIDSDLNQSSAVESSFVVVDPGVARGGCSSGGIPTPLALLGLLFLWPRRRRALVALFALVAVPAYADVDVSLFVPASGSDGLAAVEGARPPTSGEPRLELRSWVGYSVHPLMLQRDSGSSEPLVRDQVTAWLSGQTHLVGPLSLAAQVPVLFNQSGNLSALAPSSSSLSGGFGDLRLTPRLALLREETSGLDLAAQASLVFPTGASSSLSSDGRVVFEGLVAAGHSLGSLGPGDFSLLGNLLFRLRRPQEIGTVEVGNEAGLRAGLAYALAETHAFYVPQRVYTEFDVRTFLRADFAAGSTPAEWRLGTTLCPAGNLAVDAAFGTALTDGIGAPRARFLFGLAWAPSACGGQQAAQRLAKASPPPAAPAPAPATAPALLAIPAHAVEPRPLALALPLPPLPDRDGDGIPDAEDSCPDQAGTVENHGCPPGVKQQVVVGPHSLQILAQVHFVTGSARLERTSFQLLDQVAAVLQSHPDLRRVEVEGHTDDTGTPSRNLVLSQARAESVVRYLVAKGVESGRLLARGYGQSRPAATNTTVEGRALNRRVAFTVLEVGPAAQAMLPPRS